MRNSTGERKDVELSQISHIDSSQSTRTLPRSSSKRPAFEAVREARRSETAEDYVELIDDLIKATGERHGSLTWRLRMGVSHATVNRILARLVPKKDLVNTQPYRSIFLTDAGALASRKSRASGTGSWWNSSARWASMRATAERDAEGIEHYVSTETIEAFQTWTGKLGEMSVLDHPFSAGVRATVTATWTSWPKQRGGDAYPPYDVLVKDENTYHRPDRRGRVHERRPAPDRSTAPAAW